MISSIQILLLLTTIMINNINSITFDTIRYYTPLVKYHIYMHQPLGLWPLGSVHVNVILHW